MPTFAELLPDPAVVAEMQPAELGGAILVDVNTTNRRIDPYSFVYELFHGARPVYDRHHEHNVERAVLEAFSWLLSAGLLAEKFNPSGPRELMVTRRGQEVANEEDFARLREASRLPRELLHPTIADRCWLTWLRGDYETAVFQAFKEVEVAVRESGGFGAKDVGVKLMRKAFHTDDGPLTDPDVEDAAEREALQHLFAGAIGSYKNPHSHRTVALEDPREASEMLMLASHLMRIVEARR